MKTAYLLATAASVAILFAAAPGVRAQTEITGIDALDDQIDDIEEATEDEFERSEDRSRFGDQSFGPGWTGSVSMAGALSTGNTETTDFSLGGRVRNSFGAWNQTLGIAAEYGEEDDNEFEKRIFAIYDINRSLTDRLYVFGLARGEYDEFGAFQRSAFAGVGPGYRIFNTPDLAWRVQAGPGVRYTEAQGGDEETEFGAIASSRFFYRVSDGAFVTNDTDVLYSDTSTLITNDLGLNLRVTDIISTRLGYRVDYETDPPEGTDDTDTKLTAALVFSFR